MLFIPYPCFLSESFLIEMKFPPIILGGTAHEFTHLINVVSCFLLTTSSIYFSLFSSHCFAASYAFDNILPNKATKVFAKTYNKSDVLYEALNTSRVEDAGVNIPKLLEVAVTDGKWSITSEYVEGPTLTQLIEKYPDKADDYIKKMVEYQISFQKKSNPLLLVLKDKMIRQINSIEELDNSVKYELLTRLNSMKNHTKLCHGDYCPDNIIVTADAKGNIKEITAVDWVHATQGNASADIANTFLLLKLQFGDKSDIPEKYISAFCELTNTKRSYVNEWLPLVAAARLTNNKAEEKELLNQWINVVDFQ